MKLNIYTCWLMLLALGFGVESSHAQTYTINWFKISGGGGTSTGGTYTVNGTIGQADATLTTMTGGNYSLTGGFWAFVAAVQTAGVPNLIISSVGNSVTVSWPNTGNYTLLQNSALNGSAWTTSGYSISTANGTNSITINSPTGNLFFRLQQ